jgi:hypothetical protein
VTVVDAAAACRLGAGFVAENSGAASDAFDGALDQLREKYAKKAEREEQAKAEAARAAAAVEKEDELEDDDEWLDDPGVCCGLNRRCVYTRRPCACARALGRALRCSLYDHVLLGVCDTGALGVWAASGDCDGVACVR